ncbi:hypothetical protein CYG49_02610 [Candidatus Saccharibacteria bacterium]|nr:MAG: hypothetical protein CYG49_02610 [Candidatus Saccharibacteria bacterium]
MARILIIEDEKILNQAYKTILEKEGYDVACAYDGAEGLEVAESFNPDLILLDLRMPNVDGVEFLRQYNLTEKHPNVHVIVFSNFDMQKEVDEAYALGAQRYILKAWASPKDLAKIVEQTLTSSEE